MKRNLFITQPKVKIRRKANTLHIIHKDFSDTFPINMLNNIYAFCNVDLDVATINYITHHNKCVFIMDKMGNLKSLIIPKNFNSNISNRKLQYAYYEDKSFNLEMTKILLKAKLVGILKYYKGYLVRKGTYFAFDVKMRNDVFSKMIESAEDIAVLRGVDGTISKFMFNFFKDEIERNSEFVFEKREYNPSIDPINILLSIAYSVYHNYLIAQLIEWGFDPYVGIMHVKRGDHAVLASDIMEIHRPKITSFIEYIVVNKFLTPDDFIYKDNRYVIKYESLRIFLKLISESFFHENRRSMEKKTANFLNNYSKYKNEGVLSDVYYCL
jgi:CRISPR-associated protein Cas1